MVLDRQRSGEVLARLGRIATELGDDATADEASSVRERVEAGRFYVACVGQFKRGKSTLLDALLGDPVLPVGVTPVTAVPTIVRYGPRREARIRDADGTWRAIAVDSLRDYVSEERNPGNVKRVTAAEVLEPSALLGNGLCLVDTPGLGSVYDANTQATLTFVPHVDVALVVIGTDPPLSGDELRLIESATQHLNELLVVLNKADRDDPADRQEACAFARDAIEHRLGRDIGKIYEVSAKSALEGVSHWPDWDELIATLQRLSSSSGRSISLGAGQRAVARIRSRLTVRIRNARQSLTGPVDAGEARLRELRAMIGESQRKLEDLSPLLATRERKLIEGFSGTAREFGTRCSSPAHAELSNRLRENLPGFGPSLRREAMRAAQDVVRERIADWLPDLRHSSDRLFEQSMQGFADSALSTWRKVRQGAEMENLPDVDEIVAALATESRFRFNEQIAIAQPASPLRFLADVALGVLGLRRVILADAHRFLDWLLELNVGRAESQVRDRIRAGRVALEGALRSALTSACDIAEVAEARARRIREKGAAAVESELARLDALERELQDAAGD